MTQAINKKGFTFKFCEALEARNAEQFSKDTLTAINNARAGHVAIDEVMTRPEFKEVQSALIKGARIANAKQDKQAFIAVKVLVKLVGLLQAVGQSRVAELDPYSRTIIANLIALTDKGEAGITNKSNYASLSTAIEYDELEQQQSLKNRYRCSVGTASTQASSTRMMMLYMGCAQVSKGKRSDVMSFADNERARAVRAIFTARDVRAAVDETEAA